ncbi:MAG: ABC transporter substrate-binding protein [Thomasclavelia sp.]|jgi:putative ABC transport system substrate-binding protein|nr:ABC transporter substrate-binding protein [Thomasclavelia sp.]
MKKLLSIMVVCLMVVGLCGCSSSSDDKTLHIGVIQYAQHPALDASYKGFIAKLKKLGYSTKKGNLKVDYKNASGDLSNCSTIAEKFVNDNVDLIYAIATPAAQAAANKTSDIPIVCCAVTDPKSSKLVKSNKKPGTNVTGASDLNPVAKQIDLLTKLVPTAKKIGIMYCGSESNSIYQAKLAAKQIKKMGLTSQEATVSESNQIQQVTESLVGKVDAIYVPTDNLLADGMTTLSNVTNQNKIPVITGEENMVGNGGLATYGINYNKLGNIAGKQAYDILVKDKKVSEMAIQYLPAKDCTLTINKTTVKAIGITVPTDLDKDATYVE